MRKHLAKVSIPRSFFYLSLVGGLFVSLFGIYYFQQGPTTDNVVLYSTQDFTYILRPFSNGTLGISTDARRELSEYRFMNLNDCLTNRTIEMTLHNEGALRIDASVKSGYKPTPSEDSHLFQEDMGIEGGSVAELSFVPANPWNDYVVFLANHGNQDVPIEIELRQQFFVCTFQYDIPFMWLRISFVGGALSYLSFLIIARP